MTIFTSLGILVISMLILASLQLVPGIFLLLSHYSSGKFSKAYASDLRAFFIFGVETCSAIFFVSIYSILCAISGTNFNLIGNIFIWILASILITLSLFILLFYYRRSSVSELFISRKIAKNIRLRANLAKSRKDAFILGFFASVPETFITIPIYIATAICISNIANTALERSFLALLLILSTTFPLIIIHFQFSLKRNLAELARSRHKNRLFFKFFLSSCLLLIATLLIISGVI